ncbi:hypothetical protein Rcae01_02932 [Novipirellula caenicola]|uniref:Uncharacterized protein n=1 Tax=Novipirellula caenicola TaxID=1536901 RepID=A0ABP9VRQ1_9BACT
MKGRPYFDGRPRLSNSITELYISDELTVLAGVAEPCIRANQRLPVDRLMGQLRVRWWSAAWRRLSLQCSRIALPNNS